MKPTDVSIDKRKIKKKKKKSIVSVHRIMISWSINE